MKGKNIKEIVEITMDAWESEHSPIVNGEMTVWENGEPVTKHIVLFNVLAEGKEDLDCNSCEYQDEVDGSNCYECVKGIHNNYKAKE